MKKMAGGTSQKSLASSTMIVTGLALSSSSRFTW